MVWTCGPSAASSVGGLASRDTGDPDAAFVAEMISRTPLFPGDSEIDEIFRIFRSVQTCHFPRWSRLTI